MRKLLAVTAVVIALFLLAHREGVHQFLVTAGLAAGCLAAVCLAAAGLRAACRRPAPQPARVRQAAPWQAAPWPAAREPRPAARPAVTCLDGCGRPADIIVAGQPLCFGCSRRLTDDDWRRDAGWPAEVPPRLAPRPDWVPDGESAGLIDMTDFENRGTL